jgi:hypothetical protein
VVFEKAAASGASTKAYKLADEYISMSVGSRLIGSIAEGADKGTSDSLDILAELRSFDGNYEYLLNIFRRNIALRANRVLVS